MAFSLKDLTPMGPSKDAALWLHVSADVAATVEAANYFNGAVDNMASAGLIVSIDSAGTSVNLYAYTHDGTTVTLMTGAVAVTGPGVEFT